MLKNSVKIWLFQSQREGDAMAIRYAVDLTDTERAALREILSKNKAKRSTIMNAYILRNDARMPHCLRWGGMASLLGGLGDRFPQHDRDLPSKAPPLAAGIFTKDGMKLGGFIPVFLEGVPTGGAARQARGKQE